jgi:hypothetical protein
MFSVSHLLSCADPSHHAIEAAPAPIWVARNASEIPSDLEWVALGFLVALELSS